MSASGRQTIILESVDLKDLQAFFGKQLQAETKKILQKCLKLAGWKQLRWLHVSANLQGSGLPEMLEWSVALFNELAGELGAARWDVPFGRQTFVESLILPSGQVVSPDEIFPAFQEAAKKITLALQRNTGQLRAFPGKLAVRGSRLILIADGRQEEIREPRDLERRLAEWFQPQVLPSLLALAPEELAAAVLTEDDLGLLSSVTQATAQAFLPKLAAEDFQLVVVHNFRALGLVPALRGLFPRSLILWRNHLPTVDPTPLAWNYFVPLVNQADAAVFHLPEYNATGRPDLLPITAPGVVHSPSIYPYSPKNRELSGLGEGVVKRVLAQYQRDYILATKFDFKTKLARAHLRVAGNHAADVVIESMLDSLTKASIRAAFIEEGRRPEVERFVTRAATEAAGVIELVRQLHGIDPARPLFTQISRYARLKDPAGTVRAFAAAAMLLIREGLPPEERPQFAFAGTLEEDDAESYEELVRAHLVLQGLPAEIRAEFGDRSAAEQEEILRQLKHDIFVLVLPSHDRTANAIEVNALQRTSRAVLQKSLREGFGLAVTEAMWKGVPVIGGNTGGIRLQIDHGTNGFLAGTLRGGELVDSVEDAAQFILTCTRHPDVAQRMGEMGKRKVAKEFLMPVNLNLFLRKVAELLAQPETQAKLNPPA